MKIVGELSKVGSLEMEVASRTLSHRVVILAMLHQGQVLYVNSGVSEFLIQDTDGDLEFQGPVYKIALSLFMDEKFEIFYGIYSSNRSFALKHAKDDAVVAEQSSMILKELMVDFPVIFDLSRYLDAPVKYPYHFYSKPDYFFITSNTGSDACYMHLYTGRVVQGERSDVLEYIYAHHSTQ